MRQPQQLTGSDTHIRSRVAYLLFPIITSCDACPQNLQFLPGYTLHWITCLKQSLIWINTAIDISKIIFYYFHLYIQLAFPQNEKIVLFNDPNSLIAFYSARVCIAPLYVLLSIPDTLNATWPLNTTLLNYFSYSFELYHLFVFLYSESALFQVSCTSYHTLWISLDFLSSMLSPLANCI